MKILHILYLLKSGGAEHLVIDIINEQLNQNNEVTLIIIKNRIDIDVKNRIDNKCRIIEINDNINCHYILKANSLNKEIEEYNPDIIHIHDCIILNALHSSIYNKIVLTIHSINEKIRRSYFNLNIVAVSNAVALDLKKRHGSYINPIVIPNGIDTTKIKLRTPTKTLKNIICAGRICYPIKGLNILVQAMKAFPELNLTIIGNGMDFNNVKQLAHDLNIEDRIEFKGQLNRDEYYQQLHNYDAYILPSITEAFGLVIAEAMAAGLPVICSDLPGPKLIIDNGKLGITFKPGSSDALVEAIKTLQNTWDNALALAINEGVNYVNNNFSLKNTVQNYFKLYKRMCEDINN